MHSSRQSSPELSGMYCCAVKDQQSHLSVCVWFCETLLKVSVKVVESVYVYRCGEIVVKAA